MNSNIVLFLLLCLFNFNCSNTFEEDDGLELLSTELNKRSTIPNDLRESFEVLTFESFDIYFYLHNDNLLDQISNLSETEFWDLLNTQYDISEYETALNDLFGIIQVYLETGWIEEILEHLESLDNEQIWEDYIQMNENNELIPLAFKTNSHLPCHQTFVNNMESAVTQMQICAAFAGASSVTLSPLGGLIAAGYCLVTMANSMHTAEKNFHACIDKY